jgi:threonine dehydrogenase-like Zn-dependent dehydrogenase
VVIVVHGAGKVGQLSLVFAKIFGISSFLLLFKTLKELLRRGGPVMVAGTSG